MRQYLAQFLTVYAEDEDAQRRGSTVILIAVGLIMTSLLLLPLVLQPTSAISGAIVLLGSICIYIGVFFLARYGWVTFGASLLIGSTILGTISPMLFSRTVSFSIFYLVLPLLIASLTLRSWQIWPVLLISFVGIALVISRFPANMWAESANRSLLIGGAIFLGISSLVSYLGARGIELALEKLRLARAVIEVNAARLAHNNAELEQRVDERTAALQTALGEMQLHADAQAKLLDENEQQRIAIREMSVPVIPISDTTVIVPLIGALDNARLGHLADHALRAIGRNAIRSMILDITGVLVVDTHVAQGIITVVQSARLLGTEVVLVGIRPEVAQAIVGLGIDLNKVRTYGTLYNALQAIK